MIRHSVALDYFILVVPACILVLQIMGSLETERSREAARMIVCMID